MDIRQKYVEFFAKKGHKVYPSMPLVPDDASLLFTNAGMVQFKEIFTGKIPIPNPPRATSSQLCIRAGGKHNDLENVGYTARHHTLFEMLGNFSFGDYFKKDAIAYAWEFVTQVLGFDKSLLYVTVHESDDEAFSLWCEHIEPSRIKRMGDKDNFWQMGDTGPCGPCSEIYVDQGATFFHSEEDYFGGEGDRFLEIWNLVFMQYEQKDGVRTPLPKPSIDTGMGLERVVALLEGKINNFDTSLFAPLMSAIEKLTGRKYYHDDELAESNSSLTQSLNDYGNSARSFASSKLPSPRLVKHSKQASLVNLTQDTRIADSFDLESQADSQTRHCECENHTKQSIENATDHVCKSIVDSTNPQNSEENSHMDCFTFVRNDEADSQNTESKDVNAEVSLGKSTQNLRVENGRSIFDEKSGLCEATRGSYLEGNDRSGDEALHDFSRKDKPTTHDIKATQASFRVIADHARSVAFLLAQGVNFDKEGRGYVLRRILRRAVRHGYLLGLKQPFLFRIVDSVCESMGSAYPYLLERKEAILEQCKAEESRFFETIDKGMSLFKNELDSILQDSRFSKEGNCSLTQNEVSLVISQELEKFSVDRPQVLSHSNFSTQPTKRKASLVNLTQDTRIADFKIAQDTESTLCHIEGSEATEISHAKDSINRDTSHSTNAQYDKNIKSQNTESSDSNTAGFFSNFKGCEDLNNESQNPQNLNAEKGEVFTMKNRGCARRHEGVTLDGCGSEATSVANATDHFVKSLRANDRSGDEALHDFSRKDKPIANKIFSGEVAFKLYDTYGFPLDLTQDMLREYGIKVDLQAFEKCMQSQKAQAKASWKGSGDNLKEGDFKELLAAFGENHFIGYTHFSHQTRILALLDINLKRVKTLKKDTLGYVLLETTPFYPESGGPIGDKGLLLQSDSQLPQEQKIFAQVLDTQKYFGLNLSKVQALQDLEENLPLLAMVDSTRLEIIKHHSATHLLHLALRQILGSHVAQAGSLVESNRLRFDFSHPKAISHEELEQIQAFVNAKIAAASPQVCETMDIESAKAKGAMALFGEKYGKEVRVISFGDSIELCGGIHVQNTAEIGSFYITKDSGVSSGVRRIEAVCGAAAYQYGKAALDAIKAAKESLKAQDLTQGITRLKKEIAEMKERAKAAKQSVKSLDFEEIQGVKLIVLELDSVDSSEAKEIVDRAKNEEERVAILLLTSSGEKLTLSAGVKNAPLKAGAWVKAVAAVLGGNGGGRDDFATAGGKDKTKKQEALALARNMAKDALNKP